MRSPEESLLSPYKIYLHLSCSVEEIRGDSDMRMIETRNGIWSKGKQAAELHLLMKRNREIDQQHGR